MAARADPIGWANLQWPPTINCTVGSCQTLAIYGQVWIDGVTSQSGVSPDLLAWVGFGTSLDPTEWGTWEVAAFSVDAGNNDEFVGYLNPQYGGSYNYAYRYSYQGGAYVYADLNGPVPVSGSLQNPGRMTVTGPAAPVPEPGTLGLLGLGLAGLGLSRRRKAH